MEKLLKKQKEFFLSGKTKSLDFRIQKLSELRKCIIENEKEIAEALQKDLKK